MPSCLARPFAAFLLIAPLPLPALAGEACRDIVDPAARLACHDALHPPRVPTEQAYREQATARFGQRGASDPAPAARLEQLTAVVTDTRFQGRQATYTLDNGQRWQTVEGTAPALPAASPVTVRRAALSGHQLITPQGQAIRVRRLP